MADPKEEKKSLIGFQTAQTKKKSCLQGYSAFDTT
jgi:hypothetical protein